ncbi:cyanophycin synthetase [Singulisphaera sp. GP187]|uniref:cyanophycin synthetase n=1 Tax=Singulisphaera sp. GP187 TaxID=1882752 RepID=UPI00092AE0A5|nr:cyanophycin synthetase [Singulisphaera sp. GP187]SIN78621.1 cyanophycin synthetase [Singulisphaera sp. GP187]
MEFLKVLALRGPNMWANFPVLEAWVDLGALKDSPSTSIPGLNDRLMSWLPTMIEHQCSEGVRGGFFQRLREGTYPAHILEHVTLELQELLGMPVKYGRAREMKEDSSVYKVVVQYREETVGRACLFAARELVLAAIADRPFDVKAEVQRLRELAHEVSLGPSTAAIVAAAKTRGIPHRRLNSGSLIQLGQGARQRRILTAETDRTGAIAESIAQDKDLTRTLLNAVGVPVPEGRPVADADDAWEAARSIGHPVVIKPRFGNQGRGVATNLSTREQVVTAYQNAREQGDEVVVERYAPGADYRILVIDGKVVAASRREPAHVIGDGRQTIAQLVEHVNTDPRRSDHHATALSKIVLDPIALEVLSEQGVTPNSIPHKDERVLIRRNANLSTGGTASDVTDEVHPDVAARSIDAARVIGLDIAGVDIVALDISRPLEEQGGVVVEVNAGPGLRMHLEPSSGTPRPVGEAIIDMMFPEGENGRIPLIAVTGVNGKTTTTRLIAHIMRGTGKTVGMTNSDGIYIDNRRIEAGDCSGPQSARAILLNPKVDVAVLEAARGGILREGLGFDKCDVAVVTNIGEGDHLGLSGIETLEKLALVKRTIVDVVQPTGVAVLKADDPWVEQMAPKCPGSVLFFCRDAQHPVIQAKREQGGRVAFVRDEVVILAEGTNEISLAPLSRIPLTYDGRVAFQVENALAAAAAAWSAGVPLDLIRMGLATFTSSAHVTPGRFNVLEANGAAVIIDYGHNPSAVTALVEALEMFPQQRRTIIFSAEGDRRDEDIVRQTEILGDAFDSVILYEYPNRRGREPGEILGLLREGFATATRLSDIIEAPDEPTAIDQALRALKPGDLLVVQPKEIDDVVSEVIRFLETTPPKTERKSHTAARALVGQAGS